MKKFLLALLFLVPCLAHAYDAYIDGIYYNLNTAAKTAEVTYSSVYDKSYSGSVAIPPTINYQGNDYSVASIGESAFAYCSILTSVDIPNSVMSIGMRAFLNCSKLASVTIGNSVTRIGSEAFQGCCSLTSVTIPNSVTNIGGYAFKGCSSLSSVEIPNSVAKISSHTFYECSNLTFVTIGRSVTSIDDIAFGCCSSLSDIYCKQPVPPTCNPNVFHRVDTANCRIHVPLGAKEDYASAEVWCDFNNIIEDLDENGEVILSEVDKLKKENEELKKDIEEFKKEVADLRRRIETGDFDGDGATTAADVAKVVNSALKQ